MRIVFSAGGTGGHIFPLLALYTALQKRCLQGKFYFVGPSGEREREQSEEVGLPFFGFIRQSNRRENVLQIAWALALIFVAFFRCLFLFLRLKPDLVIGGGGYASLPALCAAFALRRRFILLEQNMVPGKVTRFFARFSHAVFFSFPGSEKGIAAKKKLVFGNPVREDLVYGKEEAREQLSVEFTRQLVVLVGGSRGAKALNQAAVDFVPRLISRFPNLSIFWVTGEEQFGEISRKTEGLRPDLILVPFEKKLPVWLSAADLYVGRAGAGLISEVMACGLPSVLIPYPFATDNHQLANATYLEQNGACVVLKEERLSDLAAEIERLLTFPRPLREMRERLLQLGRSRAASDIADWIRKTVGE